MNHANGLLVFFIERSVLVLKEFQCHSCDRHIHEWLQLLYIITYIKSYILNNRYTLFSSWNAGCLFHTTQLTRSKKSVC